MTRPFSVDDLYLHRKISTVQCHPAGHEAVCTVQSVDRDQDTYVSRLWALALDGSPARQLTQGPGTDSSPRFSPDGQQIAFLSDRGGSSQVYLLPLEGGEARQLGQLPQSVSDLRWAPNGQAMFVLSAVKRNPDLRGRRGGGEQGQHSPRCQAEVAWRLPYKEDGIGYVLQREFHLFRVELATGKHRQLTDGAFDVLAFAVSSDGRRIAHVRTREGRFAHSNHLWLCNEDGSDERQLTHDHAIVMQPCWSPDGRYLVFTGAQEEGDAEPRLWLLQLASGRVQAVCEETLDVADPTSVRWASDTTVMLVRAYRGRHQIVSVDVFTNSIRVLDDGVRQIAAFSATATQLVYAVDHPALPVEMWARPMPTEGSEAAKSNRERQLSQFNPWWHERSAIEVKSMDFEVPDGKGGMERINGWLLRAKGSTGPQPLLNDIHGGPASYALLDFDSNVFWQVLCSRGWSVLALNAVGSASYGREFCRRLAGHWGTMDLPQHQAVVRQLCDSGICDGTVALSGKSYGGYLTSYATGNADDWSSAVVMAPVGNIETHYGTSDGGYYADPFYMASKPRFDRELARKLSPVQHVEKSKTPTLFLQGKEDERCPKCQSEELFVTLLRAGETPAELVLYPEEGHGFLGSGKPSCREDAAGRIIEWLERFRGSKEAAGVAHREETAAEVS